MGQLVMGACQYGGSYQGAKRHGGAVFGVGAVDNWSANAGGFAHHGSEALRHGERSAWGLWGGPARIQRSADAGAPDDAATTNDAATAANPAKEERLGRLGCPLFR